MKMVHQIVELSVENSQKQDRTASHIICNGSKLIEIHDDGKSFQTNLGDLQVIH